MSCSPAVWPVWLCCIAHWVSASASGLTAAAAFASACSTAEGAPKQPERRADERDGVTPETVAAGKIATKWAENLLEGIQALARSLRPGGPARAGPLPGRRGRCRIGAAVP
mgnify:CR=1 FL=1